MPARSTGCSRPLDSNTSASSDASRVILDIQGNDSSVVDVEASDFVLAHVTVRGGLSRDIHIDPTGGDLLNTRIYGVRIEDTLDTGIRIDDEPTGPYYADDGEVACSAFVLSPAVQVGTNCDGRRAVVATGAQGWAIRDNRLK